MGVGRWEGDREVLAVLRLVGWSELRMGLGFGVEG